MKYIVIKIIKNAIETSPFIVIPWLPLDFKHKKVNGSAIIIYVAMVSVLPYIIPSSYKRTKNTCVSPLNEKI